MQFPYAELADVERPGAVLVPGFLDQAAVDDIGSEAAGFPWVDNHMTFVNARGITVVQNYDSCAIKLSRGDQTWREAMPAIVAGAQMITERVVALADGFPSLKGWTPDEITFNRYDAELGLGFHKDQTRFRQMIAILTIDGVCDLAVRHEQGESTITTHPGDLVLMRAPGLFDSETDIRPDHAVINVQTPTRLSMMLRANDRPDEPLPGQTFMNW